MSGSWRGSPVIGSRTSSASTILPRSLRPAPAIAGREFPLRASGSPPPPPPPPPVCCVSPLVGVDHDAHRGEHAVEVELPFLQLVRPDVRIVPLVIAWDAWSQARALGETLAQLVRSAGEPVLLLASSDLNHYEPAPVSE